MLECIVLSFFLLFIICLCLTKDYFHPTVIVSGLWTILLFCYSYLNHPLWDLSANFYIAISLWVIPFVCCSYIFSAKPLKINSVYKKYLPNIKLYRSLYKYILCYSLLFILAIFYYVGGLNLRSIRVFLLQKDLPTFINILFYLNTFMTVYVFYGILNDKILSKKKIILLIILLLTISILKSNKTSFLALFIGLVYILKRKNKLKIKYLIVAILTLLLFLCIVTINRGDYDFEAESALENFLYIYLLSPLTAFDSLINNETILKEGTFGESVFEMFYKIFNIFGCNFKISELGVWINVPLPTNVYTMMRGPYLDGGYLGIALVSSLLGSIWGVLYTLQKKSYSIFIVFYATMVSSLFFQSFGDYFFHSLSMTIQYYIFSIILNRGIKCL